ncbi:uncharacterized protein LOC119979810 [Tripterygium wilfordii]|uniref:uncharacterized protein LOC119979810 n=1 Tax=Tripterygium wilfordii TaxID=458696 RepID=UPI0018F86178|nr:uncharacterized protein LOC119979810 [Tripterygium wilfordii]
MKLYNGTDDPEDHMAHYKLKMGVIAIPYGMHETCICKGFGSTLTGPALRWYINLPNGSITSFEKLSETFMIQFSSSQKIHKCSDDLYHYHREWENLSGRRYPYLIVIQGLLLKHSRVVCSRMGSFTRNSQGGGCEEKIVQSPREEKRKDKRQKKEQSVVGEPSNNWRPRKSGSSDYAKNCPEYPLRIHQVEAVLVLKKMGSEVKWPPKKETEGWKYPKKWCDFHQDIGHTTSDCRGLKYEVDYLLKKGHLRDLLSKRGRAILEKRKIDDLYALPLPPLAIQTYCVISGGSEISGLSHTSTKKHEKEAANPVANMAQTIGTFTNQVMVFADDEATQLLHPHHNALVSHSSGEVTLPIYAPWLNKQIRFSILDSLSDYNAILGHHWLHAIRVVPSTYHQILRYPTNGGIKEIMGD